MKKASCCFCDRAKMASEINLNFGANWRVPLGTRVNYPENDRIKYLNVLLCSFCACKKNRPVEKWFVLKIRFDLSNPQMTFSQVQSKSLEVCWLYNKILQPFERVARIHLKFWILTVWHPKTIWNEFEYIQARPLKMKYMFIIRKNLGQHFRPR